MEKLKLWKDNMENKGLFVKMVKTKVMICGKGKDPCRVCRKGVKRNSIFCMSCNYGFIRSAAE